MSSFDLGRGLPPAFIVPGHVRPDDYAADLSGKPWPKNVRVQLNSGIEVKCDVKYAGINPNDGDRKFVVIAEIDWENYHPMKLLVEEMPNDVEFRFRVPGLSDEDANAICSALHLLPDRIVAVK